MKPNLQRTIRMHKIKYAKLPFPLPVVFWTHYTHALFSRCTLLHRALKYSRVSAQNRYVTTQNLQYNKTSIRHVLFRYHIAIKFEIVTTKHKNKNFREMNLNTKSQKAIQYINMYILIVLKGRCYSKQYEDSVWRVHSAAFVSRHNSEITIQTNNINPTVNFDPLSAG